MLADPASNLALLARNAPWPAAADDGAESSDLDVGAARCAAVERKAALLIKLARGEASEEDLSYLSLACTSQSDLACQRLLTSVLDQRKRLVY